MAGGISMGLLADRLPPHPRALAKTAGGLGWEPKMDGIFGQPFLRKTGTTSQLTEDILGFRLQT